MSPNYIKSLNDQTNQFNQLNSNKENRIMVKRNNEYSPAVLINNTYQQNKSEANFVYTALFPHLLSIEIKKKDFFIYDPNDLVEKNNYLKERNKFFQTETKVKVIFKFNQFKYYNGVISKYYINFDHCDISFDQLGLISNIPFCNHFILPTDPRYNLINEYIYYLNDKDKDFTDDPEENINDNIENTNNFFFNKESVIRYNDYAIPNYGNIFGDENIKTVIKSSSYKINKDIDNLENTFKRTFSIILNNIKAYWNNIYIRILFVVGSLICYFLLLNNSNNNYLVEKLLIDEFKCGNNIFLIILRVLIIILISLSLAPLLLLFFLILCFLFIFKINKKLVPINKDKNALKYLFDTYFLSIIIGSTFPLGEKYPFYQYPKIFATIYILILLGISGTTIFAFINKIKEKTKNKLNINNVKNLKNSEIS